MRPLRIVGMDPSLRHWGIASGILEVDQTFTAKTIQVIEPVLPTGKQTRQNSLDLAAAEWLFTAAINAARDADAVFVEVPVGSQNARAMASYGICVGVVAALRATGIPIFEVTATEVKLAAGHKPTATKTDMIRWGLIWHPTLDWPYQTKKGQKVVVESKAEHMADALAAIHAGLNLDSFKKLLRLALPPTPLLPKHAPHTGTAFSPHP